MACPIPCALAAAVASRSSLSPRGALSATNIRPVAVLATALECGVRSVARAGALAGARLQLGVHRAGAARAALPGAVGVEPPGERVVGQAAVERVLQLGLQLP